MDTYELLSADLWQKLQQLESTAQYWLALAGAPGSGKSTLADALAERLGESLTVIPMDGYHFYRHQLDAMDEPAARTKQSESRWGGVRVRIAAKEEIEWTEQ